MMVLDLELYSVVARRGFRHLLHIAKPNYKIPSRYTFSRNVIPTMYTDLRKKINDKIHADINKGNSFCYVKYLL